MTIIMELEILLRSSIIPATVREIYGEQTCKATTSRSTQFLSLRPRSKLLYKRERRTYECRELEGRDPTPDEGVGEERDATQDGEADEHDHRPDGSTHGDLQVHRSQARTDHRGAAEPTQLWKEGGIDGQKQVQHGDRAGVLSDRSGRSGRGSTVDDVLVLTWRKNLRGIWDGRMISACPSPTPTTTQLTLLRPLPEAMYMIY